MAEKDFILIFTKYDDDYKNCENIIKLSSHHTEEEAHDKGKQLMIECFYKFMCEQDFEIDVEDEQFFTLIINNYDYDTYKLKNNLSIDIVTKIINKYHQVEFIDTAMDYKIQHN